MERSLAAIPAGRSTRESLARIDDPDVGGTLAHLGSSLDPARRSTPTARRVTPSATATADGPAVPRPAAARPRAASAPSSWRWTRELHREVALKQILDQHADDPTSRQRFLLEAEVTGGLEHPGIVPVYGLGTYADGRPYYAMRFIRGDSLKEAIDRFHADEATQNDPGRRSLELRKLLRRFTDVCNAIDYAHSRGVLHRDIKPGNIIVGKHGETLVVDWGLAKATGRGEPGRPEERTLRPSSASGSAETLARQRVGDAGLHEPRAGARRPGVARARARDVYSLGATLYCLLTGRPPFEGDDLGVVLRARPGRRVPAAAAGRADDRPGAGGGLPQGHGPCSPRTATRRPGRWPTTSSGGWPTSRSPPTASRRRPGWAAGCAGTSRPSRASWPCC